MSVFYEELAPKEFLERLEACPVGYLPLGTIEWHGPHLPLGTDLFEGKDLFEKIAEKYGGIVFPPLFLGPDRITYDGEKEYVGMDNWETYLRCPKYERQQFPGSCYRVDDETYALILKNIIKQAARAGFRVLAGVGHGPSTNQFAGLAPFAKEKYGVTLLTPYMGAPERKFLHDHAAKSETSNIMYFRPELVHMDRLSPEPEDFPKGVSGDDPRTTASREYAAKTVACVIDHMGRLIREALSDSKRPDYV